MKRKIINIEEEKCNGCGLCAKACHEGAIGMVNGKAKLLRDDYCDGLGDCLPECPTGAITFVEREAAAYDAAAVEKGKQAKTAAAVPHMCPGSMARTISRAESNQSCEAGSQREAGAPCESGSPCASSVPAEMQSELRQWPVQIKLAPVNAPYFDGANLLVAADCTAYAYAGFHRDFIRNHVTLIGCPKLDMVDYSEKLTGIIKNNNIKSVKIVRMEVPCCGGIEIAVKKALQDSGKFIPWSVVTISTEGKILEDL
jgi:ferredoxin